MDRYSLPRYKNDILTPLVMDATITKNMSLIFDKNINMGVSIVVKICATKRITI